MLSGIYEIVNLVNGKKYIGSASNVEKRFQSHRQLLLKGKHHSRKLQHAWNKYGEGNFSFRIRLRCTKPELLVLEQHAMDVEAPVYNILKTAGSNSGHKLSKETRAKMSAVRKGRKLSAEHCAAITAGKIGKPRPHMIGNKFGSRKHTIEERLNQSFLRSGIPKSAEARAKIKLGWVKRREK